ncbi:MAG: hypothetical protein KME52_04865 [Desmonostoc geniculatum HA4340-LM1]|jgi:hypothetical protein|nr:hypothetical protein [Desmonostoc geniculatum HA4340-LM1]
MTKTVLYYTNYKPGDGSFLEKLQQQYGSKFEQMTRREKLLLIECIAGDLGESSLEELPRDEIYHLQVEVNTKLSSDDKTGLIEALINQIRWGQNQFVTEGELPMQQ